MNGLAVDPKIIADDTVLDVIFAADFGDEVRMICDSASRAVCRALLLAADRVGLSTEVFENACMEIHLRFAEPETLYRICQMEEEDGKN